MGKTQNPAPPPVYRPNPTAQGKTGPAQRGPTAQPVSSFSPPLHNPPPALRAASLVRPYRAAPFKPSALAPERRTTSPGGVRVSIVQSKRASGRGVIQRSTVTTALRGPVADKVLTELTNILNAAEARGGGSRDAKGQLKVLQDLLSKPDVAKLNPGSRETFGLSGASFIEGSQVLIAQGSPIWTQSVQKESPGSQFLDLAQRSTGVHDEVQHITEYPGVQALLSTQKHCLFCYGLLEFRGYDHGPLRDQPWPSKWKHDYLGFSLSITNENMDAITLNPIIKIECNWGTRYYVVS
jgi:hypothetical protein